MRTRAPALLVEDSPQDVLLFRNAWSRLDVKHPLRVLAHGEEALSFFAEEVLKSPRHPRWLTFLDLNLPGKSGFEILTWMRQQPRLQSLPVVMLTGSSQSIDVYRAYELGADGYLVKPINVGLLGDVMKKFAAARRPLRPAASWWKPGGKAALASILFPEPAA